VLARYKTIIPVPSNSKRFRRVAAILLIAVGAVAMYVGRGNFLIRSAGLLAIMGSVRLARFGQTGPTIQEQRSAPPPVTPIHLIISALLLILVVASGYGLYWYVQHDQSKTWPVYVYAALSIAAVSYWAAVFTRFQEGGSRWSTRDIN
jgi:hypothetical protein